MCAWAIDFDFVEHGKAHAIIQLTKATDRLRIPRLLLAELITGKTQHHQALIGVLVMQLLEILILRRQAALAGGVDHQQHLALVLLHGHGLPMQRVGG